MSKNLNLFNQQKWRNFFLETLIYSNIWVASAIASLCFSFQLLMGLPLDWRSPLFCFGAALIPYHVDRVVDAYVQKSPDRNVQSYFQKPGFLVWFLIVLGLTVVVTLLWFAPTAVRYVSLVGILPLIYGVPLFPGSNQWYRLKDIPGSKAWIVGGIITYAVVSLPCAYANYQPQGLPFILTTLFLFIFIVTNSHSFDLRDIDSDQEKGVITLPLMMGIDRMKILLSILNVSVLVLWVWAWSSFLLPFNPEIIIAIFITLLYLQILKPSTPRPIYSVVIDGFLFVPLLVQGLFHFVT
ncbi:UbiA family prenyltransferase [Cyanothece sp. BG0011]|uniref:UbiA family prenyltransferase n=1 Tax=Cyanothece sp. BG0011 TaxID=2082950 RepID=UPI000D1ED285|nr:UbiA family prenyltransferase [Cyanothece sp. BG0011]